MSSIKLTDVTLAEEHAKGNIQLQTDLEAGFQKASQKIRAEGDRRRAERRSQPRSEPERRKAQRRLGIDEIKRLKGEVRAAQEVEAGRGGRDTLKRDVPKIKERITGIRKELIGRALGVPDADWGRVGTSTNPPPTSAPRHAPEKLGRLAKIVGKKVLGVAGQAANVGAHISANRAVTQDINKDAPFSTKLGAYVERVLGARPGTTGRAPLPSEAKAARML